MLNIACTYLLLSTYSWLLFEAVYTVIILTLLEEKSLLEWISLTGWAAPIPMMIPYISYRLYYEDTNCWMQRNQRQATSHRCPHHILAEYDRTQMTVIKPVTTFQQLHRKRSSTSSLPSSPHCLAPRLAPRLAPGLRQASLALLILAPVFGLHLLLLAVSPDPDSAWEKVHAVLSSLSSSTHGIVVSCILCFTNKEAMTQNKDST